MQATLKLELVPLPLSLAKTMSHSMRTGKSSVAEFLTEKAKVTGVNHASGKCCFVHRWLIVIGKPEKAKIQRLFGLHVDFVLQRGSLCYSNVIGGNTLKQRQEVAVTCHSLLPFNAITGRDSTSLICKHSKKTARNTLSFLLRGRERPPC